MFNSLGKTLVVIHTVLSVAAMAWAISFVLLSRDLGWAEPYKEQVEGTRYVLYASEYDKSLAALNEAKETRDRVYAQVKPAIDSLRATEPFMPNNTLFYQTELRRLREAPDKIDVYRLEGGGTVIESARANLGKPQRDKKAVPNVTKSMKTYSADLKKLYSDIDMVEEDIRTVVTKTKELTAELTGTDEANKYVKPGLYQLIEGEYKNLTQLKVEIDLIKPFWSRAVEQARQFEDRRRDLESTLDKLKGAKK